MDTIKAIKQRRSIRTYLDKSIPKDLISNLISIANLAPSPMNYQNRHFIAIYDKELKKKIYKAACSQRHILDAPVVLIAVSEKMTIDEQDYIKKCTSWGMSLWGASPDDYKRNHKFMKNFNKWKKTWLIQDVDIALQTLIIAAQSMNIGSCWIGAFDEDEIKKILKIPSSYRIFALLTLGYYDKKYTPIQKRRDYNELIH